MRHINLPIFFDISLFIISYNVKTNDILKQYGCVGRKINAVGRISNVPPPVTLLLLLLLLGLIRENQASKQGPVG